MLTSELQEEGACETVRTGVHQPPGRRSLPQMAPGVAHDGGPPAPPTGRYRSTQRGSAIVSSLGSKYFASSASRLKLMGK